MMQSPKTPKKEKPAVTIANQANEIKNLCERIDHLSRSLNDSRQERDKLAKETEIAKYNCDIERQYRKGDVSRLEESQARLARAEVLLEGYRMAITDIVGGKNE